MNKEIEKICSDVFSDLVKDGHTTIETTREDEVVTFLIRRINKYGSYEVKKSFDRKTLEGKTSRVASSLVADFWDSMRLALKEEEQKAFERTEKDGSNQEAKPEEKEACQEESCGLRSDRKNYENGEGT